MQQTDCTRQLELFEVGRQQVTVSCDGGQVVSDAGLLPIAQLDRDLGILSEAARRLPDPRSQLFVVHGAGQILRQQVYQIPAGCPDGNDAQLLRNDPLFKTIVGVDPRREDQPLASGSTLNRFQHAFTRREAEKPPEDRDVIFEVRRAQLDRIYALNEVLKRRVREIELEENARMLWWISGRESFQLFHIFDDYQAESWSHPRRMIVTGLARLCWPRPSKLFRVVWLNCDPAGAF